MNKYTEADVNRTHKIMVEELIDQLLQGWKVEDDPLRTASGEVPDHVEDPGHRALAWLA